MKLTQLLFSLAFILTITSVKAQTFNSAIDYLNFVGEEQTEVTKSMWKYTKAVAHSKKDNKINKLREQLLKQVAESKKNISKANGFDGNDFKNEVLKLVNINESMLKQDYAQIIDMKAVAEQSYDLMEAYIIAQEMAEVKMAEAQAEYEKNFLTFAGKHNINIIENDSDLSKKMIKSNEVFSYSNKLYLVFFKVYINEIYLNEAIEKKDVSGIQQNANALNSAATEGLEILKTYEDFETDKSLILATKKVFEYQIEMTSKDIPNIMDFYIVNEDFETIKKTLENTAQNKRTKEQIDAYNKKVKDINTAVNKYNATNQSINKKSQQVYEQYNTTKDKFIDSHVPND
tara:strand:- start:28 stop:1062 length:1035 start_codon:yes stop_codon:yes gene_type:complete